MESSRNRRTALILLLGALAQPGWAVAHGLIQHDEQQHHHGIPSAPSQHGALQLEAAGETPDTHSHLDDVLVVTVRTPQPSRLIALPPSPPESVAPPERPCAKVVEGAPPRASPELPCPSQPRAPPHA